MPNFNNTSNPPILADILDEDDLASNRSDAVATQQSIKAYIDKDSIEVQALSGASLTQNYNTINAAGITFIFDSVRVPSQFGQVSADIAANQLSLTAGRWVIQYKINHRSIGQRTALEGFITVNGVVVGSEAYGSYIRATIGHFRSKIDDSIIIDAAQGDIVQLQLKRQTESTAAGPINVLAGSYLSAIKIS